MWASTLLISLSALTLTIQAASVSQECGKFNEEQYKNNQTITEPNEHPWVGRIVSKENSKLVCVGILIDARHVVTAAHCVSHDDDGPSGVIFGDSDSGNTNLIESITVHPDYSLTKRVNDLAIIKLTKDVEFTDFVQPICLPSSEIPKIGPPNFDLIAAGYEGPSIKRISEGLERSEKRFKVPFTRTDSNECHKLQPRFSPELICGQAEKDPLSGSALVEATGNPRKYHLVGIAVVGFGSINQAYHGYLNVRSYLNWIKQELSK
ncbi:venom protease [Drosophila ficusphila]|uniref:venom protease n=1 Tax=Drosophila ficusphila TaxID=30025 RepID=UPI0007E6DB64|nr:venom protease [Drosophila ficusphila]